MLGWRVRSYVGRPASDPTVEGAWPRMLEPREMALDVTSRVGKYSVSESSTASGVAGFNDWRDSDPRRRAKLYRGGGGCRLLLLLLLAAEVDDVGAVDGRDAAVAAAAAGGGAETTVCGSTSSSSTRRGDEAERHRDDRERRFESIACDSG